MTEEYKELLFDYITGQITTTSSSTDEVFMDRIVDNTNLLSLLPAGTTTYYIHGITSNNDDTSEVYALYGSYDNGGFIALLDNNFNVFEVITTFSSGTALRPIYALEVNTEDNTFFGIDYDGTTNRFIMLNNFTIPDANGNYTVKLRTSYNFSDNTFYPSFCRIFKNPTTAHYVIVGYSAENPALAKAIDLKVNVGSANEWTSYTSTYDYFNNAYVDFNSSDNALITFLTSDGSNVRKLTKDYSASTFTATNINTTSSVLFGTNNVYFKSNSQFYYSLYDSSTHTSYIYYYSGSNSLIHSEEIGNMTNFQLKGHNGDLYIYYNVNNGILTAGDTYYFRYDNTWSPIKLTGLNTWSVQSDIFIGNKFNLTKIFIFGKIPIRTETCLLVEDYNTNNYNSDPYVDGTAIYPQKARLYSSGDLVFARNDYNVSSLGNTYTATVEVPNVYLNGGSITPSQLISKTNQIIINDTTAITKNIYEKVYINFINSINDYDEDTGKTFDIPEIVESISGLGASYTKTYIYNINGYKNGEFVETTPITSYTKLGRLTGQLYISYTPSDDIDRIDFVNREGNVYLSKDVDLISGTTYDINQKVRLADIPLGDQNILYNDNKIQFNGNDVVYYTSI